MSNHHHDMLRSGGGCRGGRIPTTTMRIRRYKMATLPYTPFFGVHKNLCSCSGKLCGCPCDKWHTSGYSLYLGKYIFSIEFDKPENCDAPF